VLERKTIRIDNMSYMSFGDFRVSQIRGGFGLKLILGHYGLSIKSKTLMG